MGRKVKAVASSYAATPPKVLARAREGRCGSERRGAWDPDILHTRTCRSAHRFQVPPPTDEKRSEGQGAHPSIELIPAPLRR